MDSKDKKHQQGIERALSAFDSVEEWADYIAFLSKLLKSLQQKHTTPQWIPLDLQISIKLSKCLLPNLPSGVHQKTLEVYNFIFGELGVENLSKNANVWIPGILPIMQFASISIKPTVIELYQRYLLNLPSATLKAIVKPLLSYLLLSIDDERSEFYELSFKLIDDLKKVLDDDSLFWQSIFLIMITSEERGLGCLVWCNKRFPDLSVTVEDNKEDKSLNNLEYYKSKLEKQLNPEQLALITPEPGLLVRAFKHCLSSNNLLIQRGFFDLLIKKFQLNSTILQHLTPEQDLQDLMLSCVSSILKKDMSINRRVWSWFLGPDQESSANVQFFKQFGLHGLSTVLLNLINGKYHDNNIHDQKISCFKMALAILDKWEIGSEIIPLIFIPFLRSIKDSVDSKSYMHEEILKSGSALFDSIETLTIYSNLYKLIQENNTDFVIFILQNFNCHDEEMIVHQFPLLLISAILKINELSEGNKKAPEDEEKFIQLLSLVCRHIPERAFLPVEHSDAEILTLSNSELHSKIEDYYNNNDVNDLPFKLPELTVLSLELVSKLLINNIESTNLPNYVTLLNQIIDTIPELSYSNDQLFEILKTHKFRDSAIIDISQIYSRLNFLSPFVKLEILNGIISQLLDLLNSQGEKYQVEACRALQSLTLSTSHHYVEGGITSYLLQLDDFNNRLKVFDYLWVHTTDVQLLDRPLNIILDETGDFAPLALRNWILNNLESTDKLFGMITSKLPFALNDSAIFTYHVGLIYKVLTLFDKRKLLHIFRTKIQNEDLRLTFRDFTILQLKKYLDLRNHDANAFRVIFQTFEILFDGTESGFEDHVTSCFFLTDDFITNFSSIPQYENISMILLDHLKEVTKHLIAKHSKVSSILIDVDVDLKDKENYPFLIRFLLKGFEKFHSPALLTSLIDLLTVSLKFQDEYIFEYIEPLIFSILTKIETLSALDYEHFATLTLLLSTSEEVLSLFRAYVVTLEINDNKNIQNDPGFFSSVVSGVLPESMRRSGIGETNDVIAKKRIILNKSFDKAILLALEIWTKSDLFLKENATHTGASSSLRYQSIQFKFSSKSLLESLYSLEPIQSMKCLVQLSSLENQQQSIIRLLHVLEKTRPQVTIPNIFMILTSCIQYKFEDNLGPLKVSEFLIAYVSSLQDDSMEDIYAATTQFLRDITANTFNGVNEVFPQSTSVYVNILKFISIFNEKLSHSKFYEDRKVKREVSDHFIKLLPNALNGIKIQYRNDATADGENGSNGDYSNEELYKCMDFISSKIKGIVQDIDKQHSLISSVLNHLLTPIFKTKNFTKVTKPYHLELLSSLVHTYPTFKNIKSLINEIFADSDFFDIDTQDLSYWNDIFSGFVENNTIVSAEPNEKVNELLAKLTQSSGTNIFNWNENEQLFKISQLKRISYLMAIDSKDRYIVILKELFKKLDSLSSVDFILPDLFLTIRVILLKVSPIQLYDFWTFIYTMLQDYFVKVFNAKKKEQINLRALLQACKLLDLILILKFEDFQEWIFIIDTIDAIYRKNDNVISLIDKISMNKELFNLEGDAQEKPLLSKIDKNQRKPGLLGVSGITNINQLTQFFNGLSYYNYENMYNGGQIAFGACEQDLLLDLFAHYE